MSYNLYIIRIFLQTVRIFLLKLAMMVISKEVLIMSWWKTPKRSKFGKWLDSKGVTQIDFADKSKVSRRTVWKLYNEKDYIPSSSTLKKVMKTIRTIDKSKKTDDFFDI